MSAFEDWFHKEYNQYYSHDSFMDIDIREAFNAGRAYQRELDAKIADEDDTHCENSTEECGCIAGYYVAKAIREQKIDD